MSVLSRWYLYFSFIFDSKGMVSHFLGKDECGFKVNYSVTEKSMHCFFFKIWCLKCNKKITKSLLKYRSWSSWLSIIVCWYIMLYACIPAYLHKSSLKYLSRPSWLSMIGCWHMMLYTCIRAYLHIVPWLFIPLGH